MTLTQQEIDSLSFEEEGMALLAKIMNGIRNIKDDYDKFYAIRFVETFLIWAENEYLVDDFDEKNFRKWAKIQDEDYVE